MFKTTYNASKPQTIRTLSRKVKKLEQENAFIKSEQKGGQGAMPPRGHAICTPIPYGYFQSGGTMPIIQPKEEKKSTSEQLVKIEEPDESTLGNGWSLLDDFY